MSLLAADCDWSLRILKGFSMGAVQQVLQWSHRMSKQGLSVGPAGHDMSNGCDEVA